MYGSNSWGHQRQNFMPSVMQNPYAAALYSNVQYSQPVMSYQQTNKPRYTGPGNQHHNRNVNKNNRRSPNRQKTGNSDIQPQNIPSILPNQSTPKVNENKENTTKVLSSETATEGEKNQNKSSDEMKAQTPESTNTRKDSHGDKNVPTIQKKLSSNIQPINVPASDDKKEPKKISENELDEDKSADSSLKQTGDSAKIFPYYCELCDAKCNSESNYKDHMLGSRHLRNVKAKGAVKSPVITDESHLRQKLICVTDPVIGLNYITEFQSTDPHVEEKYSCSLCHVKGNCQVIIAHITGIKHKMAVVHEITPEQHEKISNLPNRELTNRITHLASDHEKKFGRGIITVLTDPLPNFPKKRAANSSENLIDNKKSRIDNYTNKRDQDFSTDSIDKSFQENKGRLDFENENKENKLYSTDSYADNQKFTNTNIGSRFPINDKSYWQDGNNVPVDEPYESHQYDDAESATENNNETILEKDRLGRYDSNNRVKQIDYGHTRQPTDYESGIQTADYDNRQPSQLEKVKEVQEQDPFEKFLNDDPNSLSLSKGNLGTLLKVLTKCVIKNEEDAEMALQVSNALTKSLLNYRLQNMPADVLSATLQSSKKFLFGEALKNACPTAQIPQQSEALRSGAIPTPSASLPSHPMPSSLLPTPASAPAPQHYRPMIGYGQKHYDRY